MPGTLLKRVSRCMSETKQLAGLSVLAVEIQIVQGPGAVVLAVAEDQHALRHGQGAARFHRLERLQSRQADLVVLVVIGDGCELFFGEQHPALAQLPGGVLTELGVGVFQQGQQVRSRRITGLRTRHGLRRHGQEEQQEERESSHVAAIIRLSSGFIMTTGRV